MAQQSDNSAAKDQPKSLVAFLSAIKFRAPRRTSGQVEQYFAQLKPRARQRAALAEENYWIRSAN